MYRYRYVLVILVIPVPVCPGYSSGWPLFAEVMSVYERILLSIPVDELEVGYNSVLQEEIQSVHRSVDDISTAFGKLEELRDVVNELHRDKKSTGGHSASLLEVMASTLELQRKLSTKLCETVDVVTQVRVLQVFVL